MRRCQFFTICLWLSFVSVVTAQTPADVHVKLSLAENKTGYRIGEPIKLVLEFTADREGYNLEVIPDTQEPRSDTVAISPDTGVTRWLDEFTDNHGYPRDYFGMEKLGSAPRRLELTLNDTLRFDALGRYKVNVTTRRLSQSETGRGDPLVLSTNWISFEVQPMNEADEAKEVKRLSELLDTRRDIQTDEEVTKQLSYLTGDPSTREKVRVFCIRKSDPGTILATSLPGSSLLAIARWF